MVFGSATSYLGSLNLLGYLIGALSAHSLAQKVGDRLLLIIVTISDNAPNIYLLYMFLLHIVMKGKVLMLN